MDENRYIYKLIEDFYDGKTSPEDVERITDFFRSAASLPDELKQEAAFLLAMHQRGEIEVPERLKESVAMIGRTARGLRLLYVASASVAAIVLAVMLGVALFRSEATIGDSAKYAHVERTVPQNIETDTLCHTDSGIDAQADANAVLQSSQPREARRAVKTPNRRRQNGNSAPRSSDEEIRQRKAANRTVELLNRAVSKVTLACANLDDSFQEVDNSLNDIQK